MIKISKFQTSEASRVWGDFAEKVAFTLNVDPANVLGSIAGGYAASHTYNKKLDERNQQLQSEKTIENNAYSQVESILRDLKITFTPINVLYTLNGQVFEIIKADEMTPHMKQAFLQKDAEYFRDILINKISMEMQLAEQAFAQRLLTSNGYGQQAKTANYASKQDCLIKVAEESFEGMVKVASTGLENIGKLKIDPTFETLRPFSQSEWFFKRAELDKVAGIFDVFTKEDDGAEDIGLNRLNSEINVGFLPDRVVYLWNGQMVEQMSLLNMNPEGYEAFRRKDKQFFIDFFREHTTNFSQQLSAQPPETNEEDTEKQAAVTEQKVLELADKVNEHNPLKGAFQNLWNGTAEELENEKQAASLEDIVDDLVEDEFPVMERDFIDPFADSDVHPVAYDAILASKYGVSWARHETESIFKQIEVDFKLEKGITENALNKISILHAVSGPNHAMYMAPLTFEKFIRGVNSKTILFEEFQGNTSFEEIIFGIEVAKAYDGEEVFLQFHDNIAPYVSEELMKENVRFVSSQVFDESNPSEKEFFDSVNGFLMRKWKEVDSQGILEQDEIDRHQVTTLQIIEIADEVIKEYADELVADDPYTSVDSIINEYDLLSGVESEFKNGVRSAVKENVVSHLMTALFVEYKHQELEYTLDKLREEGVING
jgi:hypothetical protein